METQICCPVNNKKRKWEDLCMNSIPLPDEIVLSSILPHLSMKEAALTSLLSRSWLRYWRHFSFLNFENPNAMERTTTDEALEDFTSYCKVLKKERRAFVNWVDNILSKHVGTLINDFRVAFYLQNKYRKTIDKWVVWALSKHVQRLELDFSKPWATYFTVNNQYVLDTFKVKPVLTSLCLKSVNVGDEFVENLFESCGNILESLWIDNSEHLTRIERNNNVACSALRFLRISDCSNMKTIDIQSPKLVTFVYESGSKPGLELLCIENASCLSHVTIQARYEDRFFILLRSLVKYFSQLEYLKLNWWLNSDLNTRPVVDNFPVLPKLKHLHMRVHGKIKRNIAGWIPFIQACPILQKLTIELYLWLVPLRSKNMKRDKHPLHHLKTFEILRFNGDNVDIDVAKFVFENGVSLQEVVLQRCRAMDEDDPLPNLKLKIPKTVKLIRTT